MKTREEIITETINNIESTKARSAWKKGVKLYAVELAESLGESLEWYGETGENMTSKAMLKKVLNGADDWSMYSWGGCSLIFNYQIAERLCNPTELKRTRDGMRNPNPREQWLDTQTRALFQAFNLLWESYPESAKANATRITMGA